MRVARMHNDDLPHGFTPAERISNAQRNAPAVQPTGLQCIQDPTIPVDPLPHNLPLLMVLPNHRCELVCVPRLPSASPQLSMR